MDLKTPSQGDQCHYEASYASKVKKMGSKLDSNPHGMSLAQERENITKAVIMVSIMIILGA